MVRNLIEKGHEKKAYTITGNQTLSITEAIRTLARGHHDGYSYDPVSAQVAREFLKMNEKPEWVFHILIHLFGAFKSGAARPLVNTPKAVLGQSHVSFEPFIVIQAD